MKEKTPKNLKKPTPEDLKRKHQTFLADIGGGWFVNQMKNSKPQIKIPRSTKKKKERENPTRILSGKWSL